MHSGLRFALFSLALAGPISAPSVMAQCLDDRLEIVQVRHESLAGLGDATPLPPCFVEDTDLTAAFDGSSCPNPSGCSASVSATFASAEFSLNFSGTAQATTTGSQFIVTAFATTTVTVRAIGGDLDFFRTENGVDFDLGTVLEGEEREFQITVFEQVTSIAATPQNPVTEQNSIETAITFERRCVGACVSPDGSVCVIVEEELCPLKGGTYLGDDTLCGEMRWKNPAGGVYATATNWEPEQVPVHDADRNDTAVFDLTPSPLSPPVQITASNATAGKWVVNRMAVDFTGPGSAQLFGSDNPNNPSLEVGQGGQLGVVNGFALTTLDALIGLGGDESKVFVIGPASRWTNTDLLTIGAASEAAVIVRERGTLDGQGDIEVGDSGAGTCTLTVESGGTVQAAEVVAGKGQTQGIVTVRGVEAGARSTLQLSEALRIGHEGGDAQLLIEDGGRVLAPVVSVGEDTANGGDGEVTISGIHAASGRRSTLLITGTDERIFSVGGNSGAQVEVKDGGSLATFDADIGDQARPGKVVVHNPDSDLPAFDPDNDTGGASWSDGGRISVGSLTEASEIVIQDRGVVGTIAMDIGHGAFQIGRVTVSGDDALLEVGELTVGSFGSGELLILSGAKVVSNEAEVGVSPEPGSSNTTDPNAISRVIIDGNLIDEARWEISGDLNVGVNGSNGQITLLGDPILSTILAVGATVQVGGTLTVATGGVVQGTGTLDADNRVVNGGIIVPGLSPGVLVVEGDYEQGDGGTLVMEAAGLGEGQFDVLKVTGNARLGGTLLIKFIDGFVPQPGDILPFLQISGSTEGQFSQVQSEGLPEGLSLAVDPVTGTVTVQNGLPGAPGLCGVCGAGTSAMLPLALICITRLRFRQRRA